MNIDDLRVIRIGPYAAFDVLGTVAIAGMYSKYSGNPLIPVMIGTFVLGELSHVVFKIPTPFTSQVLD